MMLKPMLDRHEEIDIKDIQRGITIIDFKRVAFERQISEAVHIQKESCNKNILNSKAKLG